MEGSSVARSAASSVIDPAAPPVNGVLPSIGGTALDGQSLTASNGTWTGTAPMSFTRKWLRCAADGTACAAIGGATAANYVLAGADVGKTIRLEITASNADGATVARSEPSPIVDGLPPVNAVAPPLGGTPRAGQTLSSSTPGSWDGSTPMTYTRRWERCNAEGASCVPISGATGTSYVLTDADARSTVRVVVTATNSKS